MTKLSNSGLLDGDVAKNMNAGYSNPNRAERLQRTTQFAENPEQAMEEPVIEEETHNFNYSEPQLEAEDEKQSSAQLDKYSVAYPEPKKEQIVEDDKIFGMNKWLVVGIAATVVAVGGYFVYTKYFKKVDGAAATAGAATSAAAAPAVTPATPLAK